MDTLVQLDDSHFLVRGRERLVYRHPLQDNLLIKVARKSVAYEKKPWYALGYLIPRYKFSKLLVREFMEHIHLRFHGGTQGYCLQHFVGLVDTNLGLGQVVKAEKDATGCLAKTLKTLLEEGPLDAKMQSKLQDFYAQLLRYQIRLNDFNLKNIVYAYDPVQGYHFVLVDGMGDKTLIPFLRWCGFLRKRTARRKIRHLQAMIESWGR